MSMSDDTQPFGWQPMATAPRDGTEVDLWSPTYQRRTSSVRFIKGADVDERYAPGGAWAHLSQDGWRHSTRDSGVLTESQFSHWRLTASDRPA